MEFSMSTPFFVREHDLTVLGELFVEFSTDGAINQSESFHQNIGGGETYTAITASRLGSKVRYISTMGRDPFHSHIREKLHDEKINTDHLISTTGYNGIYFINDQDNDFREYLYHRPGSAATETKKSMIDDQLIKDTKIIYSTSEFQAVSKTARQTVFKAFESAHTHETMVAYDPNIRLHRNSLEDAKEAIWSIFPFVDVMLPSAPQESKALFGYERPVDVIGFLWDRGVHIVAVKNGPNGCMVGYDGKIEEFTIPSPEKPVQYLPLIGSVFNGAFLHSIANGYDPFTAGELAVEIATEKGMSGLGVGHIPDRREQ